jgi:hypothetical protein
MTTKQAFIQMIQERGIHNKLGISSGQVRFYRNEIKSGKVSLDKMEDLLQKAGWTKIPEQWKKES